MKFLLFLVHAIGFHMATTEPVGSSRTDFAADLFQALVSSMTQENVIFAPVSIHGCLSLLQLGAGGQTAAEIRQTLRYRADVHDEDIAESYRDLIRFHFSKFNYVGPKMYMANRLYVRQGVPVLQKFSEIATEYFKTDVAPISYADPAKAVQEINKWVAEKSAEKIKNVLAPDAINADTNTVLLNAVHFKGEWVKAFNRSKTEKGHFRNTENETVLIDMMHVRGYFKYIVLTRLDAVAVELPYNNTDLSMVILLPNQVNGLLSMEAKLATADNIKLIKDDISHMTAEDVAITLPKFAVEYEFDLKSPLEKLGTKSLFTADADLSGLSTAKAPLSVIKHKVHLEVNEYGSEFEPPANLDSLPEGEIMPDTRQFNVDRSFLFAIRCPDAVYFVGHVLKL